MHQSHVTRLSALKTIFGFNPKIILDIGAARGQWSEQVKPIFPDAQFLLVEGDPRLERELESKGFPHEITVLSAENDIVIWTQTNKDGYVGGHIKDENTPFGRDSANFTREIKMTMTLPQVVEKHQLSWSDIGLIKMDIQGHELEVLTPCIELLKKFDTVLILEVSLVEYNKGSPLILETLQFMDKLGYEMCDVVDIMHMGGVTTQIDGMFCKKGQFDIFSNRQPPTVIVTRFNEDISWLQNFKSKTLVYNKGSSSDSDSLRAAGWNVIDLPNVGREAHTILTHIINNYHRLPSKLVFTQGRWNDHRITLEQMTKFITLQQRLPVCPLKFDPDWRLTEFKGPISPAGCTFGEYWQKFVSAQLPEKDQDYLMQPGAFLTVTREQILFHPIEFYQRLLKTVNHDNAPEAAHYLERLWLVIFK